ncbi:hypothetical protein [Streptomyces mutabilis]|uniref:Uncharacterized protein n=1 Tax=Streptomyces mutabilis TaxID=67332 RepID=A0A086N0J1_9ACTN|nr:hypothetical protein [Streptomyces mutabilis]KFG74659.1 hypothetical protein FM21_00330 [Streptomyces mutabilis]
MAFVLSGILPPPARPLHALPEAGLVLTGFGVLAALARHPHTVTASRVVLHTGFVGSLDLPRTTVRSAARTLRTIPGRRLRRVPTEPAAVACSLGGTTSVRLHLDPPVPMDLGDGDTVTVDAVYVSADRPDARPRRTGGVRTPPCPVSVETVSRAVTGPRTSTGSVSGGPAVPESGGRRGTGWGLRGVADGRPIGAV